MSMYECDECGYEHSTFAKIFLAVNTNDPIYPYHETEFEKMFNELPHIDWDKQHYTSNMWKEFWSWLGDNRIKWFCCIECAQKYLEKQKESNNDSSRI